MKKLITFILLAFLTTSCTFSDKPAVLFNTRPIDAKSIYDYSKYFQAGQRIYYVVLMPKKVESRYLYIQVIKKDNSYGQLGYNLFWTKNIRLKDEEVNYFTDYVVINESGYYIMKVYSKDNPHKVLAQSEFYVGK